LARAAEIVRLSFSSNIADDCETRWDHESVHAFTGTHGGHLLSKVSKAFPELRRDTIFLK
jgi:hypothetical protein